MVSCLISISRPSSSDQWLNMAAGREGGRRGEGRKDSRKGREEEKDKESGKQRERERSGFIYMHM